MHRTSSVDFMLVLDGKTPVIMDEGQAVLRAGDVPIRRGAHLAVWHCRHPLARPAAAKP